MENGQDRYRNRLNPLRFFGGLAGELETDYAAGQHEAETREVPVEVLDGGFAHEGRRTVMIKMAVGITATGVMGIAERAEAGEEYVELEDVQGRTIRAIINQYDGESNERVLLTQDNGRNISVQMRMLTSESQRKVREKLGTGVEIVENTETGFPARITMVQRGKESGTEVTVDEVYPVHANVPVECVKIKGKWYAVDGLAKSSKVKAFPVAQSTLDQLAAARKSPTGRPNAYGFDVEFRELDTTPLVKAPDCIATECTEYAVFFTTEDRGLISTGTQPTTPEGEPIRGVHWMMPYGRDTLLVYTDGGKLYKIVGKEMTAELVSTTEIVRRDQAVLVGARMRSQKVRSESQRIVDNPGFYADLGSVVVGAGGRLQANWVEQPTLTRPHESSEEFDYESHQDLSEVPVTVDRSAINLGQKNVAMVASNQLGGFDVVHMEGGQTRVTTYAVDIEDQYEGTELKSVHFTYVVTNTPGQFAAKAREAGFDSTGINHVATNGPRSNSYSDRRGRFLEFTRIYRGGMMRSDTPGGSAEDLQTNMSLVRNRYDRPLDTESLYNQRVGLGYFIGRTRDGAHFFDGALPSEKLLGQAGMSSAEYRELYGKYNGFRYLPNRGAEAIEYAVTGSSSGDFGGSDSRQAYMRGLVLPGPKGEKVAQNTSKPPQPKPGVKRKR